MSVYASRDGLADSDVAEFELTFAGGGNGITGDVNGDGTVDVANISTVISIMASK